MGKYAKKTKLTVWKTIQLALKSYILPLWCLFGDGFTGAISGDGGADPLRGVPIIWHVPRDGTKGPE